MENEYIGELTHYVLAAKVHLLFTSLTLEIIDHFSLQALLKTLVNVFVVFNIKCLSEKWLSLTSHIFTGLANFLLDCRTLEDVSKQMLLTCPFNDILNFVEEFVQELLCISLNSWVCWLTIHLLKRKTEFSWVDHCSFTELEAT